MAIKLSMWSEGYFDGYYKQLMRETGYHKDSKEHGDYLAGYSQGKADYWEEAELLDLNRE